MTCKTTEIAQTHIQLEDVIYSCSDNKIKASCITANRHECPNISLKCDVEKTNKLYCTDATLMSNFPIICNSTLITEKTEANAAVTILHCYYVALPEILEASTIAVEPEKELSVAAHVHTFLMFLIGKSQIIKDIKTTQLNESSVNEPDMN